MKGQLEWSQPEIQEKISIYLLHRCNEIVFNKPLFSGGQLDSIEAVNLILFIEKTFLIKQALPISGIQDLDDLKVLSKTIFESLRA